MSAPYLGDFAEDSTHYFNWSTNDKNGASITRATDGEIRIYRQGDVGQTSLVGISDSENGIGTGIHRVTMILTDAFYQTGQDYDVVLLDAVIDGEAVNAVIAHFSIENRFMRGTDSAATEAKQNTAQTDLDTLTDARGEPGQGAPPVSASTNLKIDYLFKNWRNKKRQDSDDFDLYADDASTVDHNATISDDGSEFIKGEMGTGA